MVLRTAFSVVTGIGFSRFESATETVIHKTSNPAAPKMICLRRRLRVFRAAWGEISGVVRVWCIGDSGSEDVGNYLSLDLFQRNAFTGIISKMQDLSLSDSITCLGWQTGR